MSTTEDESNAAQEPLDQDPLGRSGLPLKVSRLRSKLSQKAKQENVVHVRPVGERYTRTFINNWV